LKVAGIDGANPGLIPNASPCHRGGSQKSTAQRQLITMDVSAMRSFVRKMKEAVFKVEANEIGSDQTKRGGCSSYFAGQAMECVGKRNGEPSIRPPTTTQAISDDG
jgi:hypothetical protein